MSSSGRSLHSVGSCRGSEIVVVALISALCLIQPRESTPRGRSCASASGTAATCGTKRCDAPKLKDVTFLTRRRSTPSRVCPFPHSFTSIDAPPVPTGPQGPHPAPRPTPRHTLATHLTWATSTHEHTRRPTSNDPKVACSDASPRVLPSTSTRKTYEMRLSKTQRLTGHPLRRRPWAGAWAGPSPGS